MMVLIRCHAKETARMSAKRTLIVTAAAYQDLADAEADYEAVNALYNEVGISHEFDAAVLTRDKNGEVKVVKEHEQPTGHGAAHRLAQALAVGVARATISAVGLLGETRGPAGGAVRRTGTVTGHMKRRMDDEDFEAIAAILSQGQAGLIVVYEVNMADQIAANIESVDTAAISKKIDTNVDEVARELQEAGSHQADIADRRESTPREPRSPRRCPGCLSMALSGGRSPATPRSTRTRACKHHRRG
jgi:uncharacterized membrane protein